MNKFQFMGRLTRDPEARFTPNTNTQVTTFSIAVNRRFADQNGERKADFFNLTAFGKLAEFCAKYYRKYWSKVEYKTELGMIKMVKKDMQQII